MKCVFFVYCLSRSSVVRCNLRQYRHGTVIDSCSWWRDVTTSSRQVVLSCNKRTNRLNVAHVLEQTDACVFYTFVFFSYCRYRSSVDRSARCQDITIDRRGTVTGDVTTSSRQILTGDGRRCNIIEASSWNTENFSHPSDCSTCTSHVFEQTDAVCSVCACAFV